MPAGDVAAAAGSPLNVGGACWVLLPLNLQGEVCNGTSQACVECVL